MPARQHFIDDGKSPRLANGNVLVPPGSTQKRNLAPMSPGTSLTNAQKTWITDTIAAAVRPLQEEIARLTGKAPAKAKTPAPLPPVVPAVPAAGVEEVPATDAAFSPAMMAILANVRNPAQKKKIVAIFRADKPEAVKLAEARAALKTQEAIGDATLNADD